MCLQRKRKNHFYELNTMKHNWEYKKLGEIASLVVDGDWIESKDQSESGIRLIQTGNVGNGVFKPKNDKPHYITEETFNRLGCTEIFEGDCLVSRLPDPIGRACLIPNMGNRMITAVDCSIIRFDNLYLPQMFVYFSQSSRYADYISNSTKGSTRKRISRKNLETIPIPLPPLPIQQKIVAELDKVCLIIDKKKQQLKELDNLAQAIFYDMFGDPVENEKGWNTCMLGDMCEIGSSKRIFAEEYTETGIPFYRGKEVSEKSKGQPTSIELYISSNRYAEIKDKYGVPKIGDILLTAVGTIGNIWVVDSDEPFYFKDGNVLWLQKKTEASSIYLKYLLEDLIEVYKKSMANGCAYNALTIMNLKKMPISIIPLALQQSFAAKIEAIEKQKELISRSIKEAQTLFDERMDYWFD